MGYARNAKAKYQQRVRLILNTPATQTVSLTDAKEYLKVDTSADDNVIQRQIKSAEGLVRQYLSQSLRNETMIAYYDNFPCPEKDMWWDGVKDMAISELSGSQDFIDIPWGPNVNVTEFVTIDDSDTEYLFPATSYKVDSTSPHGRVSLTESGVWPTTTLRANQGIKITFTSGYGADVADVPEQIQQAILETIAALYEKRGDGFVGLPPAAMSFLQTYREMKL